MKGWYNIPVENKIQLITQPLTVQQQQHFQFQWGNIMAPAQRLTYGYFRQKTLLGLITFERHTIDQFNKVYNLEVQPDWQRQGIGATLLAQVMLDAFAHDFDGYVWLKTKTNGVEQFYLHLGAWRFQFDTMIFETAVSRQVVQQYLNLEV